MYICVKTPIEEKGSLFLKNFQKITLCCAIVNLSDLSGTVISK